MGVDHLWGPTRTSPPRRWFNAPLRIPGLKLLRFCSTLAAVRLNPAEIRYGSPQSAAGARAVAVDDNACSPPRRRQPHGVARNPLSFGKPPLLRIAPSAAMLKKRPKPAPAPKSKSKSVKSAPRREKEPVATAVDSGPEMLPLSEKKAALPDRRPGLRGMRGIDLESAIRRGVEVLIAEEVDAVRRRLVAAPLLGCGIALLAPLPECGEARLRERPLLVRPVGTRAVLDPETRAARVGSRAAALGVWRKEDSELHPVGAVLLGRDIAPAVGAPFPFFVVLTGVVAASVSDIRCREHLVRGGTVTEVPRIKAGQQPDIGTRH